MTCGMLLRVGTLSSQNPHPVDSAKPAALPQAEREFSAFMPVTPRQVGLVGDAALLVEPAWNSHPTPNWKHKDLSLENPSVKVAPTHTEAIECRAGPMREPTLVDVSKAINACGRTLGFVMAVLMPPQKTYQYTLNSQNPNPKP